MRDDLNDPKVVKRLGMRISSYGIEVIDPLTMISRNGPKMLELLKDAAKIQKEAKMTEKKKSKFEKWKEAIKDAENRELEDCNIVVQGKIAKLAHQTGLGAEIYFRSLSPENLLKLRDWITENFDTQEDK